MEFDGFPSLFIALLCHRLITQLPMVIVVQFQKSTTLKVTPLHSSLKISKLLWYVMTCDVVGVNSLIRTLWAICINSVNRLQNDLVIAYDKSIPGHQDIRNLPTHEQTAGLNIITAYMIGYLYPERPVANMCFKVYGYISMIQALTFIQDFKLGRYIHDSINPSNLKMVFFVKGMEQTISIKVTREGVMGAAVVVVGDYLLHLNTMSSKVL
ncbi:hypothetical protein L2E82_31623 [Cichorium intybus]|uniref:Uncharacterized protein n=1 Tax=Cichorium intybus TaxID=13427 RepID=A0ACB9BE22_CICIN|nr:hypothetical protein L2E82_31623 [Cichorium intybus]